MRELVYVDVDLVGMKSRVREVEMLLDLGSNDGIKVVGICGMGGSGKSTLARVLYDKISHHFHASHFLPNLSEFYIKRQSCGKNVLIILDDIKNYHHLSPLIQAIRTNWLGRGSRIIVTTRDESVLKQFRTYDVHRMKLLTKDESLQLFCRKAFKRNFIVKGYEQPINSVLQYANGLPLAIVILGSLLYNRRVSEWRRAWPDIKRIANHMIMKVLQKSFNELKKDSQEIFLDIACFFAGKEIKCVEGILQSLYYSQNIKVKLKIQLLIEKSLITTIDQKIQMHGLLREMGREIEEEKALFETERGKGSLIYRPFSVSVFVCICLIWVYRLNQIPKQGQQYSYYCCYGTILAWLGLLCAELWFGFYWILTQSLRWNLIFRHTFKDRLSLRFNLSLSLSLSLYIYICIYIFLY